MIKYCGKSTNSNFLLKFINSCKANYDIYKTPIKQQKMFGQPIAIEDIIIYEIHSRAYGSNVA